MTVIVTGGRDYKNEALVRRVLRELLPTRLYVGDATGVDAYAWAWAEQNDRKISKWKFEAEWDIYGKSAGPRRNNIMLGAALWDNGPSLILLAFPGGRGTADCIRQAKGKGIIVLRVDDKEERQDETTTDHHGRREYAGCHSRGG